MRLSVFSTSGAVALEFETLELPELGTMSTLVLVSDTSEILGIETAGSADVPPNFNKEPGKFEGLPANPELFALGAPLDGLMVEMLVEDVNERTPPEDIASEAVAVTDTGDELETCCPSACGTVTDL